MSEEKKIQEIFDALKSETLTERERFVMRKELELLMKDHPLRVPFYIRVLEFTNIFALDGNGSLAGRHAVSFAFALVLVLGVGTSFAAENALPGDVLYPMKINVNEQVQGALAISDVAKVEWSSTQTERRLEEAEVLAAKGDLSDQNSMIIADQIAQSSDNFDKHVEALATVSPSDSDRADDAQSNFDASLSAHEQLLSKIGNKVPKVKDAINPIIATVRSRTVKGGIAATAAPMAMSAMSLKVAAPATTTTSSVDKNTLAKKKQRAVRQLQEVRDLNARAKTTLGTSSFTYFHSEASTTAQTISDGDQKADEGDYDTAIQSYQQAIQDAAEAKAGINAEIHLRQNVDISNLDLTGTSSDDTSSESEKGGGGGDGSDGSH